ncbi:unnamed protein product [Moneuplotes crassus]|uniref:Ig-like domain-containing protein n=1 Tax=Euplotes crassus TaxID=5936 RepID=A0AAD1XU66_EUPCR|nr:unnamed protein product [Moneuplotes crassus]
MYVIILFCFVLGLSRSNTCKSGSQSMESTIKGHFELNSYTSSYFSHVFYNSNRNEMYFAGEMEASSADLKGILCKTSVHLDIQEVQMIDAEINPLSYATDPDVEELYFQRYNQVYFTIMNLTNNVVTYNIQISDSRMVKETRIVVESNQIYISFLDIQDSTQARSAICKITKYPGTLTQLCVHSTSFLKSIVNFTPTIAGVFIGGLSENGLRYFFCFYLFSGTASRTWSKELGQMGSSNSFQEGGSLCLEDYSILTIIFFNQRMILYNLKLLNGDIKFSSYLDETTNQRVRGISKSSNYIFITYEKQNGERRILQMSESPLSFQTVFSPSIKSNTPVFIPYLTSSFTFMDGASGSSEYLYIPGSKTLSSTSTDMFFFSRTPINKLDNLPLTSATPTWIPTPTSSPYGLSSSTDDDRFESYSPTVVNISVTSPIVTLSTNTIVSQTYALSVEEPDFAFQARAGSVHEESFDWTCTLSNQQGNVPTWVSVDTTRQVMILNPTPNVTEETEYTFNLEGQPGSGLLSSQIIKITVLPCLVVNCELCIWNEPQKCESCSSEYKLNNEKCNLTENATSQTTTSNRAKEKVDAPQGTKALASAVIGAAASTAVVASLASASSMNGCFSVVNLLQLYILLPMLPPYFPEELVQLIIGLDFSLISLNFIPIKDLFTEENVGNWVDFPQTNEYLGEIGIGSESAFIQHLSFFTNIIILALLHLPILLVYLHFSKKQDSRCMKPLFTGLHTIFTFNIYIRLMIEGLLLNSVSIFQELRIFNTNAAKNMVSLALCFGLMMSVIILMALSVAVFIKSRSVLNLDEIETAKEFFSGIKDEHYAKMNTSIFMCVRVLSVIILIILKDIPYEVKSGLFCIIHCGYFFYLLIVRPYQSTKDNLIETILQLNISMLALPLTVLNSSDRWSDNLITAYTFLLFAGPAIACLISFGDMIKSVYQKLRSSKRLKKKMVIPVNPLHFEENKTGVSSNVRVYKYNAQTASTQEIAFTKK